MDYPLVTGPEEDPSENENSNAHASPNQRRKRRIPTEQEALEALAALAQLLLTGMLNRSEVQELRQLYAKIIELQRGGKSTARPSGVAPEVICGALRDHPELAKLLEPLLSDDDIAIVVARAKEHGNGDH